MTAGQQTVNFSVQGLRCGGCALSLERAIVALDQVANARVNATTNRLSVTSHFESLNCSEIASAAKSAGFQVEEFEARDSNGKRHSGVLLELAVAAFGLMNVMVISFAVWAGIASDMGPSTVQFMNLVSAMISTPVLLFAGRPFYSAGLNSILARRITMDVAISIAILGTFMASLFEAIAVGGHVYFDAALALTFFLLVGRQLDVMMRSRSNTASENLRNLMETKATVLDTKGDLNSVPITELARGDFVMVGKGSRLPADGVLQEGSALLDESLLTGESQPSSKSSGDRLFAGTLNLGEPIVLSVTHAGSDTSLEEIVGLVQDATATKGKRQHLADKFASSYGRSVVLAASGAFVLWWGFVGSSAGDAFQIAVAVLVVTCPCAAGLATPAVVSRAANLLLERGILLRNGAALEDLPAADLFALDKTGTLSIAGSSDPAHESNVEQSREGLVSLLDNLKASGRKTVVVSGDKAERVQIFADQHGIKSYCGEVSPEQKLKLVQEWQSSGDKVVFAGDGLNDVGALEAADVSISFADASEIARSVADIVVLRKSLNAIIAADEISRLAKRKISHNLTFAAVYNIVTVPVAIAGFLTPFWAAIFMSASSVIVMSNAYLLKGSK